MDSEKILKKQTCCSSCEKLLKKPKILPCLHPYCSPCLDEIIQEDEGFVCQKCHEVGGKEGATSIPRDILAESLIYMGRTGDNSDKVPCSNCYSGREPAINRCVDCGEFLCSECTATHHKARQTKDHEVVLLKDPNDTENNEEIAHRNIYCEFHPSEELRYYCEQAKCKKIICRECTIVKHKGHKYVYMSESAASKELVSNLQNLVEKLQEKVNKVTKTVDDVKATSDLITGSIAGLKNSIRGTATEMVRHIRVAEEEMITEIDRVQSRKFHGLNKQLRELKMNLDNFETGKFYTENALKYLSEIELFLVKEPVSERLKILTKKKMNYEPVEDNNLKHVCLTKEGAKLARRSLGYLELDGNIVVNGCVRDLPNNISPLMKRDSEAFSHLRGITVDIKGPEGELLNPVKTEKMYPGEYGVEFEPERSGVHNIIISINEIPVQQFQLFIGNNQLPSAITSPSPSTAHSFGYIGEKFECVHDVHGIAVDNEERIVITDSKKHQIKIFDMTGRFIRMFGRPGTETSQFDSPHGIAINQHGDLVVADTGNNRIQIFDSDCRYIKSIDSEDDDHEPFRPYGVAVDHRNFIVGADREKCMIRIFNEKKEIVLEFGSLGSDTGEFINPSYLAVNQNGHILVSDMGNDRVQVFTSSGQFLFTFGNTGSAPGEFRWPTGIAVKRNGDIIVADSCNNRLQTFRSDGSFQSCHGPMECRDEAEMVKLPEGVAVNDNCDVIVADWGNNRVQILEPGNEFGF